MSTIYDRRKRLWSRIPPDTRRLIQKFFYRMEAGLHKTQFRSYSAPYGGWPIILNISIPKSGTYLLNQILTGFSKISPFAPSAPEVLNYRDKTTGKVLPPSYGLKFLYSLKPLEIGSAHLIAHQDIISVVTRSLFIPFFIYRDPRDIVVSSAYFFGEMVQNHALYKYLHPLNMDERIKTIIVGMSDTNYHLDNTRDFFIDFLGWMDQPEVYKLRYEDVVLHQATTIRGIASHFLSRIDTLPASLDQIKDSLISNINPDRSPTFRSGKTGDWRNHFNNEHKKIFKDIAGDLLVQLEYEKNNDW